MWLKGEIQSISKPGAIQLAFTLGLSPEEAGPFLHRVCGEGFHWRDPVEIVFLYALREGMSYPEALALRDAMEKKALLSSAGEDTETLTNLVRSKSPAPASWRIISGSLKGSLAASTIPPTRSFGNI